MEEESLLGVEEVRNWQLTCKKFLSELIGTFILVFLVCSVVTANTGGMVTEPDNVAVLTQVALTGGMTLASIIQVGTTTHFCHQRQSQLYLSSTSGE